MLIITLPNRQNNILHNTAILHIAQPPGLIRTIFVFILTDSLRRSQPGHFLRGFWVDDGGVAALQVLCDASWVFIAVLHFALQEVVIELGDTFKSLACMEGKTGRVVNFVG